MLRAAAGGRDGACGGGCAFPDRSAPASIAGEHGAVGDGDCAGAWSVAVFNADGEPGRRTAESGVDREIVGAEPGGTGVQSVWAHGNHDVFDVDEYGARR